MTHMGRLLESNASQEPSEYDDMDTMRLLDVALEGHDSTDDATTQNPEALLDLITMTSLKGRYGDEHVQGEQSRHYSNDDVEFEHYVQQFPIDDKISECFSSSDDVVRKKSSFLAGGRRPTFMRCQNWKKKLGWKSSGHENNPLFMREEDSRSSGSKRSRTIRRLLHMPRKSKTSPEKTANTCMPDASSDILTTWNSPCQDITNSYKRWDVTQMTCKNENRGDKGHHLKPVPNVADINPTNIKSGNLTLDNLKHDLNHQFDKATSTLMETTDAFSAILVDDATTTIHQIRILDPLEAMKMRDKDGNNLLHRCVMIGHSEAVTETLARFPGLCSDLNNDRMTPLELAAKIGQVSCLQYLLDKTLNCNVLGLSLITRLLTVSAANGKEECLELLLERMSEVEHDRTLLPRDRRGNTAAHIAAKYGQLSCLQLLVRKGFDVCTKNSLGQRPLDISQQLKRQECFQYLLLVETCRSLIDSRTWQCRTSERLKNHLFDIIGYLEQLRCDLQQVQKLFIDTRRSLEENKECAIRNLSLLHAELGNVIVNSKKTVDTEEGKRKLNEFKAQIERLEDAFEFSPLAGIENAIARLFQSMHDAIQSTDSSTEADEKLSGDELSILSSIFLQRIHESTSDLSSTLQSVEKLCKQRTHLDRTLRRAVMSMNKACSSTDVTLSTESNFTTATLDKSHLPCQGNVSEDHFATVDLPPACNLTMDNQSLIQDDCMDSCVKSNDYEMLTCGYVSQGSPDGNTSVYSRTLTSVTPDVSLEETSHITSRDDSNSFEESFISNDVTSESHSYWWDLHEIDPGDCVHEEEDARRSGVRINIENEDAPNEQLRKERLRNHLFSMQNARNPSKDFIETITTASGKRYGGPNSWQRRPVVNVNEARTERDKESHKYSKLTTFKPIRKLKVRNFNSNDVVKSQLIPENDISETCRPSEIVPSTLLSMSWHESHGSYMGGDEDESTKAWYEVSEDDSSMSRTSGTKEEDETEDNRTASNS